MKWKLHFISNMRRKLHEVYWESFRYHVMFFGEIVSECNAVACIFQSKRIALRTCPDYLLIFYYKLYTGNWWNHIQLTSMVAFIPRISPNAVIFFGKKSTSITFCCSFFLLKEDHFHKTSLVRSFFLSLERGPLPQDFVSSFVLSFFLSLGRGPLPQDFTVLYFSSFGKRTTSTRHR